KRLDGQEGQEGRERKGRDRADLPALPAPTTCDLVRREAVEVAGAARADQIGLAAAAAGMRRVPRAVVAALLVRVAELGAAYAVGVARPVAAGVVHAVGIGSAVGLRAGENIVLVRRIADAVGDGALVVERNLLAERVANTGLLDGVSVELGDVLCDPLSPLIEPRPVADAIACVDGASALRA